MNAKARMTSKGHVVLPKAVREAHGWKEGTEFEVVNGVDFVTLKQVNTDPQLASISFSEFVSLIPSYDGPEITDEMIEEAIVSETRRRWNGKGR